MTAAAITLFHTAVAQKAPIEIKDEKNFYKDVIVETDAVTIKIDNLVSNDVETKFKLKITNKNL